MSGEQTGSGAPPASPLGGLGMIWAQDRTGLLGAQGEMLWRVPADFTHFKAATMGCGLVMGRTTWDSLGGALPGRRNVVLTRDGGWRAPGALRASSLREGLSLAARGLTAELGEDPRTGGAAGLPRLWVIGLRPGPGRGAARCAGGQRPGLGRLGSGPRARPAGIRPGTSTGDPCPPVAPRPGPLRRPRYLAPRVRGRPLARGDLVSPVTATVPERATASPAPPPPPPASAADRLVRADYRDRSPLLPTWRASRRR